MADQAAMKSTNGPAQSTAATRGGWPGAGRSAAHGEPASSPSTVVSNVASFGEKLLNLTELQGRLAVMELKQNVDGAKAGASVVLTGAVLAVAGLPVALAGIAELLVSELTIKRGYALLLTSATAIVIGGVCAVIGSALLGRRRSGFPLTGEELTRNLNWLRTVLQFSGRFPTRR